MKIEKQMSFLGDPHWINTTTGTRYGSVVGGLAWPGINDGYIVIAAVELCENLELEAFPISVLAEAGDSDAESLFKLAINYQYQFSMDEFYGDTKNVAMVELLDLFNRDRYDRKLMPLYLTQARGDDESGKLLSYFQLIRKLTRPGRKILHFGEESSLPGYLLGASLEEVNKATALDHPCVAALGYAVSALHSWRPQNTRRQIRVISDFDPFDIENGPIFDMTP
jgi:hypothetical protein